MKVSFTKIAVVLFLCIIIFTSICPPSFATPRRVEECGLESYVSKADPVCGAASYINKRSPACGVEKYKEQSSKSCPGYINPSEGWFDGSSCPAGFTLKNSSFRQERNCALGPDSLIFASYTPNENYLAERSVENGCGWLRIEESYCVRSEFIPKCRLSAFGVDKYKSCSDPSHGAASYKTCASETFGKIWKECEIRKTKAELTAYIGGLDPNIDVMGVALVQNTGNLLKLSGNETAMACYIKRWDSDPLYKDSLDELKTIQFPALFGVPYDPNNYDCSNPSPLSLFNESCSNGTPRCKFQTAYNAALNFFKTNKAEVAALLDDVVARNDSTYKTQLESLNAKMDSYYKP